MPQTHPLLTNRWLMVGILVGVVLCAFLMGVAAVHGRLIRVPAFQLTIGQFQIAGQTTTDPQCSPFLPCRPRPMLPAPHGPVITSEYLVVWIYVPTEDPNVVTHIHRLCALKLLQQP
jgi:hypothetical protein